MSERMRCLRSHGMARLRTSQGWVYFDESRGMLARVRADVAQELVDEGQASIPSPWEIAPGNWLVRRRGGLGDVLCLSATLRKLREYGGEAQVVTHRNYSPIFDVRPDLVTTGQPVIFAGWLEEHPGRKTKYAAQCFGDFWNLDVPDARPDLNLSDAEKDYGKDLADVRRHGDAPLVAIFARAGWETRTWTGFLHVAKALAKEGCAVLYYGDEVLPCCTRPPAQGVRDLAALLSACDLVVTGDSGPMHLAAAVGTPAVAVFCASGAAGSVGPGYDVTALEPEGMDCWPCWSASCRVGEVDVPGSCIEAVTPDRVTTTALARLAARATSEA